MPARQLRSRNQVPAVDYFYSAAKRRSSGALWPIFAPALIEHKDARVSLVNAVCGVVLLFRSESVTDNRHLAL
jgi:hypothetical protein